MSHVFTFAKQPCKEDETTKKLAYSNIKDETTKKLVYSNINVNIDFTDQK